jgi:CHAD domain-containing protein
MATLDLSLPPEDAPRLSRSRTLSGLKSGHARSTPARIIWHDSPDGSLAAEGVSLAETRNVWRMERLYPTIAPPDVAVWPPAAPPPVIAEAATTEDLGQPLPPQLMPVAAFEGRLVTLPLGQNGSEASMSLMLGRMRAVTSERECCRVRIEGADAGDVAMRLTAEFDLRIPRATLAAEALSVARGTPIPPRASGAPVLPPDPSVGEAHALIVGQLTDVIVHMAARILDDDPSDEPVHQLRVAIRRLKSGLAVFGRVAPSASLGVLKPLLKALNSKLGPARDWDVFIAGTAQAVGAAFGDEPAVVRLIEAAERRRRDCYVELHDWLDSSDFRGLTLQLALFAADLSWREQPSAEEREALGTPVAAIAGPVLDRLYKNLVQHAENIDVMPLEALHPVRLDGKRIRYVAEFFATLYPGREARRFVRRLATLQDELGRINDVAVASTLLAELPGRTADHTFAVGVVRGFVAAHASGARDGATKAWKKLYRQGRFWHKA